MPETVNGDLHGDRWHDRDGYRACEWCGSMHPADFAALLRLGAFRKVDWADWKYGWPHKLYADTTSRIPLTPEELAKQASGRVVYGTDADGRRALWNGAVKFYSVHLRHATPDDVKEIEQVARIRFVFDDEDTSRIRWARIVD